MEAGGPTPVGAEPCMSSNSVRQLHLDSPLGCLFADARRHGDGVRIPVGLSGISGHLK